MEADNDDSIRELDLPDSRTNHGKSRRCCNFTPQTLVCFSHGLSAWGDRMWEFAVALYLVELTPGSLRLTAIFQLTRTLCTILLGPYVGAWVDANPRLKVAQRSLVAQNLAVAASALILLLILSVKLFHGLFVLLVGLAIFVACFSVLAGIATKIAVQKDWVVVICQGDKSLLAGTNAIMRRIDLVCKILAPALVGQVMTYVSKSAGVILIASWNVLSVFVEYFMLLRVYHSVPSLAHKKIDKKLTQQENPQESQEEIRGSRDRLVFMETEGGDSEALVSRPGSALPQSPQTSRPKPGIIQRLKTRITTTKSVWQVYMRQEVARPGVALAILYFTVISFGSVTTGYLYTQNLSESLLSILRGVGALFGIAATFVFPKLRDSIGLVRSGLFSMSAQFICVLLCLGAVLAPGSPFELLPDSWRYHGNVIARNTSTTVAIGNCTLSGYTFTRHPRFNLDLELNATGAESIGLEYNTTVGVSTILPSPYSLETTDFVSITPHLYTSATKLPTDATIASSTFAAIFTPSPTILASATLSSLHPSNSSFPNNCTSYTKHTVVKSYNFSYVSVILLLSGIITSRFGLWLTDLTVTQLQQEIVAEEERGRVGAVQKSLCSMLDMAIYVLVISLPLPEQFGYMAIISVAAVGFAGILYASFSYKVRGHLFHLEKVKGCGYRRKHPTVSRSPEVLSASRDSLGRERQDENAGDDDEKDMLQGVMSTRNENFKF
ncbi:solute carrier family 40 member 1 [Nematostella vectensis]|uniref:solute carrier family 40 member 1 n=1 Tax=Nematostella vectensis TaxID=45351 RepID=UPI00138FC7FF|nr:solute carrier family 40 member 1 [Nematostella vectensis]